MVQQHGLSWGAIDMVSPEVAPPTDGWLVHAMADGTNFGNPKALLQVVKSLLTDGSLAALEGWDNREVSLRLRLSAPSVAAGPALAAAEAALFAQVLAESKEPLVWTPSATDAPTCVFDVVAAELVRDTSEGWDLEESMREYRYYLLTLTCLPFVRGEETTVVPALGAPIPPGSATTVNIDTCDSTVGWVQLRSGGSTLAPGSGSGWLYATGSTGSPDYIYALRRTGTVVMGVTPYVKISAQTAFPATMPPTPPTAVFTGPGGVTTAALSPISAGASSFGSDWTDYYFQPGLATIETITIRVQWGPPFAEHVGLAITNVARTDTLGDFANSTTRQLSRTASVLGSTPTQASIRLFDATPAALGTEILVHTSRNNQWQPPLRKWRAVSAAVTADNTLVSGGRNTLASPMTFRMPANLLTEGTYGLMARMNVTTAGALGWSARMVSSTGATTVGSSVVVSGSINVPTTGGAYKVLNLAALPLPVLKAEADQMVELTLTGTANMTIDEGWLFGLHDGALTWLQDADSMTWIEIRSPELGAARPSVYGGTGAKGTGGVCVDWKCQSFGAHRFEPGLMQIFTVTTTSLVSQSEIEFYERGHSHMTAAA